VIISAFATTRSRSSFHIDDSRGISARNFSFGIYDAAKNGLPSA
jgi:hypothetical protein